MAARRSKKASKKKTGSRKSAASPSTGATRPATGADARSPFSLHNEAIESALLTGELDGPLEDYFGEAQYDELRSLAREASSRAVRGAGRVSG